MKIIDILNAKANGTLEDGFKFKYEGKIYTFINDYCGICTKINNRNISIEDSYRLNIIINDEVEVISDEIDIDSIEELDFADKKIYTGDKLDIVIEQLNKMAQAVKQLNKKYKRR